MPKYAQLEGTVYFWFGANDTSGSGGDGASPVFDVRLAGAAADAIPTYSDSATLLSHANYPAGCHEVAVPATDANGFAANGEYAVFCTLAIDAQNPTGFVGSFVLDYPEVDLLQIGGEAQSATDLKDFADTGYDPSTHRAMSDLRHLFGTALSESDTGWLAAALIKFLDVATPIFTAASPNVPSASLAAYKATGFSTHSAANVKTAIEAAGSSLAQILADTNELQTDWKNGGRLDLLIDALGTMLTFLENIAEGDEKIEFDGANPAVITTYTKDTDTVLVSKYAYQPDGTTPVTLEAHRVGWLVESTI